MTTLEIKLDIGFLTIVLAGSIHIFIEQRKLTKQMNEKRKQFEKIINQWKQL